MRYTLSPALSALLLRPAQRNRGPLGLFFDRFNRAYATYKTAMFGVCRALIRKSAFSLLFLGLVALVAGWFGKTLPTGFLQKRIKGSFMSASNSLRGFDGSHRGCV